MNTFKSVEIAAGIFWVGNHHALHQLHSNPYLIVEGEETMLIDGGSRPDFSTVIIKIIEAGVNPSQIDKLLYHHYDPDLCGSISNFEDVIKNPDIEIISHRDNNQYIEHYSSSFKKRCITEFDNQWSFRSGRLLQFITTPFAHTPGSFVTYDAQTKTLFSSDLFGSFSEEWTLFYEPSETEPACTTCDVSMDCDDCYLKGLIAFHEKMMPSNDALYYALDKIDQLDIEIIAPQHGQIIVGKAQVKRIIGILRGLKAVGIDKVLRFGERA